MRILHCIPSLGAGGAERQLSLLAPEQARHGHEVHLLVCRGGPHEAALRGKQVVVHRLGDWRFDSPIITKAVWSKIRELQPQVIQSWLFMNVHCGVIARTHPHPWIASVRAQPLAHDRLRDRVERAFWRNAAAVVSNSKVSHGEVMSILAGSGVPSYVIPNAVPARELAAGQVATLESSWERPILLYVGRLTVAKNLSSLLEGLSLYFKACQGTALICGDGELRQELVRQVAFLGLRQRVQFLGHRSDVAALLRAADVFVSVSHTEGSPNTVLEALAAGAPGLVLSDIGPHREVAGDYAEFVDASAPASIADGLTRALGRARGVPGPSAALAGRSVAEVAAAYLDLFRSLLLPRPPPGIGFPADGASLRVM